MMTLKIRTIKLMTMTMTMIRMVARQKTHQRRKINVGGRFRQLQSQSEKRVQKLSQNHQARQKRRKVLLNSHHQNQRERRKRYAHIRPTLMGRLLMH